MPDNNRFIATGTATVRMLTDYLNEIDNRLARYAFFLHKLQPFHNGRITLWTPWCRLQWSGSTLEALDLGCMTR